MTSFIRSVWPFASVFVISVILVLQMPFDAIFFKPVAPAKNIPFASFVKYDDEAYAKIFQRVRMSWQLRGTPGKSFESHVDAFEIKEDVIKFEPMAVPRNFSVRYVQNESRPESVKLRPPGLSVPEREVVITQDHVADPSRVESRNDLLRLPESLRENTSVQFQNNSPDHIKENHKETIK